MRSGRRWVALAGGAAAVAALVLAASGLGSTHALRSGTIVVGFGNNLTGFLAVHDHLISDGARFAVGDINAKGGIGGKVKIKLVLGDVKSDPATAVEVANDLIAKKVTALILPCNTDFQVAMASVAQRKSQFTLSPCNADPTVPKRMPIYWPVGMAANAEQAALVDHLKRKGVKTAYVLDSNFLYINLESKYFAKAAATRGIRIIGKDNIPFGATGFPNDYSSQVTKIANLKPQPDVIMTALFTPFVDTLIKQLRQAGVKTPVVGTAGMDTPLMLKAGGPAVEGTTFTTFGFPSKGSPTEKFYRAHRKSFASGSDGVYSALGYNTIKVLEAAILEAESTDPAAIQKALAAGLVVNGPLGAITYPGRGEHNPVVPISLVTIRKGKFALVWSGVPKNVPAP